MASARAWSFVKTRKVCRSTSGAKPGQSLSRLAMTPATKLPCPSPSSRVGSWVQLDRSLHPRGHKPSHNFLLLLSCLAEAERSASLQVLHPSRL